MNSIGTLYIDCPEQERQNAFDAGINITEDEYVKMLREYSYTIGMPTRETKHNSFHYYDIDSYNENVNYAKSTVRIFDIKGCECNINELYRISENGVGVIIIDIEKMDDNFESEFKFWKQNSMNINNDKNISKDERIKILPKKDLKFEIDNHVFMFYECKIYYEYNTKKVALIIKKIKEI